MRDLYLAEFNSVNFDFVAVGWTEQEARKLVLRAAKKHSKEYQVSLADWFSEDDVNVTVVREGHAYRDGREII